MNIQIVFLILQGSPYRRPFDKIVDRCIQAGLIGKWIKDIEQIYLKQEQKAKVKDDTTLPAEKTVLVRYSIKK